MIKGKRVTVHGIHDERSGIVISDPIAATDNDLFVLVIFDESNEPKKIDVDFLTFEEPHLFEGYRP